jgi:WD repeat-containing protein 48
MLPSRKTIEVGSERLELEQYVPLIYFRSVNLGKWALGNLFAGLVKAEAEEIAQGPKMPESSAPSALSAASITRGPAPTFIALDRASSRRARSQSLTTGAPVTPGALMVGLATPAITPAVLPPAGSRGQGSRDVPGGLPIIPQSPATLASAAATPMSPSSTSTALRSPKAQELNGPKDYFSIKTSKPAAPDRQNPLVTPGGSLSSSLPAQTPGGSFMGKFKGFGGKGKKSTGPDVVAAVPVVTMIEESEEDAPNVSWS